jgi:hypothetical protein
VSWCLRGYFHGSEVEKKDFLNIILKKEEYNGD